MSGRKWNMRFITKIISSFGTDFPGKQDRINRSVQHEIFIPKALPIPQDPGTEFTEMN
jgi:hypothetical protein